MKKRSRLGGVFGIVEREGGRERGVERDGRVEVR
jgi:hypothetical protein